MGMTMGLDLSAAANQVSQSLSQKNAALQAQAATGTTTTTGTTGTTGSTGTSTSSTDNSDITSNDFLTLLVTEMQNQDPTQPTDPNAYIQQLVGVNSLQQLISINGDLTPTTSTTGTGTGTTTGAISSATGASL